jgi:hypothetical protein
MEWDALTVKAKLISGELKTVAKKNCSSAVWNTFSLVVIAESSIEVGFVECKLCRFLIRYRSGKNGTSTLNRHKCSLQQDEVKFSVNSPLY